jgi:hypothetical protein
MNARDYVHRYIAFYEAMKAEDPAIVILGPDVSTPLAESNLGDGKTFIQDFIAFLDDAGKADYVNGIDFHWYPTWSDPGDEPSFKLIGQLADYSAKLRSWCAGTKVSPDVPVFLSEFNLGLGGAYVNRLSGGLWIANALGEWIRLFGKGGGANLWTLLNQQNTLDPTNPKIGDVGYLRSGPEFQYQEHATYWAMQMMSTLWAVAGDEREHQLLSTTTTQPSLASYATLRPDGRLAVAVINQDKANAYQTQIDLGQSLAGEADLWVFDANNYVWRDDLAPAHADPDQAPTHTVLAASGLTNLTIPPFSLTVIRFPAETNPSP